MVKLPKHRPENTIILIILTDLIFRRNHQRRSALSHFHMDLSVQTHVQDDDLTDHQFTAYMTIRSIIV